MLHEGASTSAGNIGRTAETAPSCCCGRAPDTTEASRRYSHVGAHGYVRAVIDSTVDGRQRTTALLRSTSTRSPGYEPAVTKSGHAWRRHRGAEADARPQMRGRTWLTGLGRSLGSVGTPCGAPQQPSPSCKRRLPLAVAESSRGDGSLRSGSSRGLAVPGGYTRETPASRLPERSAPA